MGASGVHEEKNKYKPLIISREIHLLRNCYNEFVVLFYFIIIYFLGSKYYNLLH